MTDKDATKDTEKPLTLSPKTLTLKKGTEGGHVRQSFAHGRSKTVTVEVKRKRVILPTHDNDSKKAEGEDKPGSSGLTQQQIQERLKALHGAMRTQAEEALRTQIEASKKAEQVKLEEEQTKLSEKEHVEEISPVSPKEKPLPSTEPQPRKKTIYSSYEEEDDSTRRNKGELKAKVSAVKRTEPRRRGGKLTVVQALRSDEDKPTRSLASMRRFREKRKLAGLDVPKQKVVREVIIPEVITVQELANRLAERGADVIKALMNMGVMGTNTQSQD
ncbi:MAG: translation initiation factor IF-2 associated domain-containing protein, partial [Alphaproteobacteria bacterium]|nr:translation initiation factor IF-2 associated domain-containing protein [Alphaproteobacteria bacterium]